MTTTTPDRPAASISAEPSSLAMPLIASLVVLPPWSASSSVKPRSASNGARSVGGYTLLKAAHGPTGVPDRRLLDLGHLGRCSDPGAMVFPASVVHRLKHQPIFEGDVSTKRDGHLGERHSLGLLYRDLRRLQHSIELGDRSSDTGQRRRWNGYRVVVVF